MSFSWTEREGGLGGFDKGDFFLFLQYLPDIAKRYLSAEIAVYLMLTKLN